MKKSPLRIAFYALAILGTLFWSTPRQASAHPLGEASISQYSALLVSRDCVGIRYVADMAEIPTFVELGKIRPDRSTDLSATERDNFLASKAAELSANLSLTLDGKRVELQASDMRVGFPPGNGGAPTLRFEMQLSGKLQGNGTLQYKDGNFVGRKGWKEVVARPAPGVRFEKSSVPQDDKTEALTVYNLEITSSPPDETEATISFQNDGGATSSSTCQDLATGTTEPNAGVSWARQRDDAFAGILNMKDTPLIVLLGLAFLLGAGHALGPGHGKALVGAYLVGSRGTPSHAVILGLTVTISHTIGVFLLGVVVLTLSQYILPESVYPFLGFTSGLLIMVVGLVLFVQRLRFWRQARATGGHGHSHSSDTPAHEHDGDPAQPHKHGLGKEHTHLPADGSSVSIGSLLALGITGGIIPCPSALVVLLVAIYTNQVALGLLLIVAFSLGLASVLTGIGLLIVLGRNLLSRLKFDSSRFRTGAILGRLPMASALAVTCLGVLIAFSALATP